MSYTLRVFWVLWVVFVAGCNSSESGSDAEAPRDLVFGGTGRGAVQLRDDGDDGAELGDDAAAPDDTSDPDDGPAAGNGAAGDDGAELTDAAAPDILDASSSDAADDAAAPVDASSSDPDAPDAECVSYQCWWPGGN